MSEIQKNQNKDEISQKIIKFLQKKGATAKIISEKFKLYDKEKLLQFLEALEISSKVVKINGEYQIFNADKYVVGYFQARNHNRPSVLPFDRKIPRVKVFYDSIKNAKEGDIVLCEIKKTQKSWKSKVTGKITRVIKARPRDLIGVVKSVRRGKVKVLCFSKDAPETVFLTGDLPEGIVDGTILQIELANKLDKQERNIAKLKKILGSINSPKDEHFRVIGEFGLRFEYSEAALSEAESLARDHADELADIANRSDLTNLTTITVDPDEAKDFDDAISLEFDETGNYILGVHIADVSHFVKPESELDIEARLRGVTAYLPGATLHMLPNNIAANLCSLNENDVKFAKSVFITYDSKGKILSKKLIKSAIKSNKRMTYKQVKKIIDNDADVSENSEIVKLVHDLKKLTDILYRNRREKGAFELNIIKPSIKIDDAGFVTEIIPDVQDESHNLVEECMLAANVAVAEFLLDYNLPYICRSHPAPEPETIAEFEDFLIELGFNLPKGFSPSTVQELLDNIADKPGGNAVHLALLKSMSRAVYEAEPKEHYALQFKNYTHFTSPIRRYPDLIVHQILDAYFAIGGIFEFVPGQKNKKLKLPNDVKTNFELEMPFIALKSSDLSRKADHAELRLVELKIMRQLMKKAGQQVMCTLTAFVGKSIYCLIDDYLIEGLLEIDEYSIEVLDTEKFVWTILARNKIKKIRIGDRIQVYINRVDLLHRNVYLSFGSDDNEFIQISGGKGKKGKFSKGGQKKKQQGKKHRSKTDYGKISARKKKISGKSDTSKRKYGKGPKKKK